MLAVADWFGECVTSPIPLVGAITECVALIEDAGYAGCSVGGLGIGLTKLEACF